jgi:hypothetical protein
VIVKTFLIDHTQTSEDSDVDRTARDRNEVETTKSCFFNSGLGLSALIALPRGSKHSTSGA